MTREHDDYWNEPYQADNKNDVAKYDNYWDETDQERGDTHFWIEPKPLAAGRHAGSPKIAKPVRLVTKVSLLGGLIGLAAAICGIFGLIPRPDITAISEAISGPAPGLSRHIASPQSTKAGQRFTKPSPPQRPTQANSKPEPKPKPSEPPSPRPTPTTVGATPPPGPAELALDSYFNNIGITSNSNPTIGNIDGAGAAFSLQSLAINGVRPGDVITYDGISFAWPDIAAGKPDNVTASGQTLRVRGAGTRLAFLLTAGWGPAQGTATVVYSDGSTQKFTIGSPDWYLECNGPTTPDVVIYTHTRNQWDGHVAEQTCVYYASIRLRSARPVTSIILPHISPPQPRDYDPSLHIFAITIS
jgi:hypothetical protein